jgi:hypothetical protein
MEAVADGGPSANPPAASFYGEREYDSEKIRPDLTQTTILDGPLVAQSRGLSNSRAGLAQRVGANGSRECAPDDRQGAA